MGYADGWVNPFRDGTTSPVFFSAIDKVINRVKKCGISDLVLKSPPGIYKALFLERPYSQQ